MWANCLTVTGERHVVAWMREEGLKMYGKALKELGRCLGTSKGLKKDALIATVKLLGMFEVWLLTAARPRPLPSFLSLTLG